ncbi:MAG TPA: OsmC family protein [Steroidobacteraceae bacterium]|nr:OsmC family protein [Steroidobacteraceae bacterium]
MASQQIAAAVQRAESVLSRRPSAGLQDDASATVRWQSGLRMLCEHENGASMQTDMPTELGGTGDQVSPGWMLRAGLAACIATRISMAAATQQIQLTALEVVASSRSDARGLLGMKENDGSAVNAGPRDVQLNVRIAARDVKPERLRSLVRECHALSPISVALQTAVPVALHIDVEQG